MNNRQRRILVTGDTGFVGAALRQEFSRHSGVEVLGASRSNGFDLLRRGSLDAIGDVASVVHLAGFVGVPESWQNPVEAYHSNFVTTLNVLEYVRKRSARMVLLSSYIYGPPKSLPVDEDHPPNPESPYARSKRAAEVLAESYAKDFAVPVTILRPFNLYGRGQRAGLIPQLVSQARQHGAVNIQDRRPRRDYLNVSDLAAAIVKIVSGERKTSGCETFNLGTGVSHSVDEVINILSRLLKRAIDVTCADTQRPNEIPDCRADTRRIQAAYAWSPAVTLEEGLRDLLLEKS